MAETKNVYEQLEELKEKLNEANKPRTLVKQLANDAPAVVEFVKNAKRVWRYHGEHSDFNRNLKKVRKRGIIYLLLLLLQFALPFLLVSATPYAWILVAINSMLCFGYGAYSGYKFFKKREYEIPYDKTCGFGQYNEYDDNGIIISTENGALLKAFKLLTELMPIAIFVFSFFCLGTTSGFIAFILCLTRIPLSAARFSDSGMGYTLFFVDDKNEIEYHLLKDFMKRNKLK
mgnify:FL=1